MEDGVPCIRAFIYEKDRFGVHVFAGWIIPEGVEALEGALLEKLHFASNATKMLAKVPVPPEYR